MDILPSDDQQQIIDSVRNYFSAEFPLERLRPERLKHNDSGRGNWSALGDLGFFGLGIAVEQGGAGFGICEELLLFREAGRFLVTPCLLANVMAARLAVATGLPELAGNLISGAARAALALPLATARIGPSVAGEFQLFDAAGADVLVSWNEAGAVLLPAGIERSSSGSIDEFLPIERASLAGGASLAFLAAADDGLQLRARLFVAAQLVGLAEAARDMAAEYAKIRQQFGQPIGAFQGIKHKCADMAVRCEAAWFQTVFAALTVHKGERDAAAQVAASLLLSATAAHENAAANLQVHGGIGYTAECDAHHFVKRARILERLAGGLRAQQRALLSRAA